LKLADWCRQFVRSDQGGLPCEDRKQGATEESLEATDRIVSETALDGLARGRSPSNANESQPDRRQAASTTSHRKGGGA
jgi:hypothetical protein